MSENNRSQRWKKFKNLADSIELAEQRGLIVSWDKKISEITFDAVIETIKPPYHYIIVVRCIESKELIKSEEIDEFCNQAKQIKASIAILASDAEFEKPVEINHSYEFLRLCTLETINQNSPEYLTNIFDLLLNEYDFRFLLPDGSFLNIPDEPGLLKSLMKEIEILGTGVSTTPELLVNAVRDEVYKTALGVTQEVRCSLPEKTIITNPFSNQKIPVHSFIFNYRLFTKVDLVDSDAYQDSPYLIDGIIEGELLKRNDKTDLSQLEKGFNTTLEKRKYYYSPQLQFSYYCEKVKKGLATIVLIEGYEFEELIQERFSSSAKQPYPLIEITNQEEIGRLKELYEKFIISNKNLRGRFETFLETVENVENIDKITLTEEQKNAQKADYFFNNREITVELKSLETDSFHKIEKVLSQYENRPEFPLMIFGAVGLQQVLKNFPDKDKINGEIVRAITDSIERDIKEANRQIRETKKTFALPNSKGVLIILNDLIYSLSPELIMNRILKSLIKKTPEKEPRYPFVSTVLLIHSAHYTQINPKLQALPIVTIPNPSSENQAVNEFVNDLISKWTKFEGVPFLKMSEDELSKLRFKERFDSRAIKNNQ